MLLLRGGKAAVNSNYQNSLETPSKITAIEMYLVQQQGLVLSCTEIVRLAGPSRYKNTRHLESHDKALMQRRAAIAILFSCEKFQ